MNVRNVDIAPSPVLEILREALPPATEEERWQRVRGMVQREPAPSGEEESYWPLSKKEIGQASLILLIFLAIVAACILL